MATLREQAIQELSRRDAAAQELARRGLTQPTQPTQQPQLAPIGDVIQNGVPFDHDGGQVVLNDGQFRAITDGEADEITARNDIFLSPGASLDATGNSVPVNTENAVGFLDGGHVVRRDGALVPIAQSEAQAIVASQTGQTAGQAASEVFGFDPAVTDRNVFIPKLGFDKGGFNIEAPEILIEALRGFAIPGAVVQGGNPTMRDVINFLEVGGAGGALRGAIKGRVPVGVDPTRPLKPGEATPPIVPGAKKTGLLDRALGRTVEVQDPAQARRAERFAEQDIVATTGDITQDLSQQTLEQRLLGKTDSGEADVLRSLKLKQNLQFQDKVNELVRSLGVPEKAGEQIKLALTGTKELLRSEKNALYKKVAKAAPDVLEMPIFTDAILKGVADPAQMRRTQTLNPSGVAAVKDLLVEFGVDQSEEAIEAFVKSGGEVTPLNLGNFETFRQALNAIERSDQTAAIKVITGPIKAGLDKEARFIDDAVREAKIERSKQDGIDAIPVTVLDNLKDARKRVVQLKKEFSPESLTGKLIRLRKDNETPVVEASKVVNELLKPGTPIEQLTKTMKVLNRSDDGQKAIGDLQGSLILNALEKALKAPSLKQGGIDVISGNVFERIFRDFGEDKLKVLFKGNKNSLRQLKRLRETGLDMMPGERSLQKGSSDQVMELLSTVSGLARIIRPFVRAATTVGKEGREIKGAVRGIPAKSKRVADRISKEFPTVAARLGILQQGATSNNSGQDRPLSSEAK